MWIWHVSFRPMHQKWCEKDCFFYVCASHLWLIDCAVRIVKVKPNPPVGIFGHSFVICIQCTRLIKRQETVNISKESPSLFLYYLVGFIKPTEAKHPCRVNHVLCLKPTKNGAYSTDSINVLTEIIVAYLSKRTVFRTLLSVVTVFRSLYASFCFRFWHHSFFNSIVIGQNRFELPFNIF